MVRLDFWSNSMVAFETKALLEICLAYCTLVGEKVMGRNNVQSNFAMNTKCLFNLLCHEALLGTHSFSGIVNLLNCIDNGRALLSLSHFGSAEKPPPLLSCLTIEGKRAFRLTGSAQPEKIDVPSVDRILIVHSSHELNEMIVLPKHCFQPRIHR